MSYTEFWLVHLRAHQRPVTRLLYYAGTVGGPLLLAAALASGRWWLVPVAVAVGYGLA